MGQSMGGIIEIDLMEEMGKLVVLTREWEGNKCTGRRKVVYSPERKGSDKFAGLDF